MNLTTNFTRPHLDISETLFFGFLFSFLTIIGCFGNVLVIVAISTDAKMRKSAMNQLLLNLAIADLGNLLFCIPEWTQPVYNRGPVWFISVPLCPIFRYLEVVFLFSSLLTQVAVCIERFIAIVYPMKVRLLHGRYRFCIASLCLWSFSLLFAMPYAIYHQVHYNNCVLIWSAIDQTAFLVYKYVECLLFYFLPLIIIVALYIKVSRVLWSKNQQLHEGKSSQETNESLKVRKNVVKMLIGCVGVYFICYSPIQAIFVSSALFGHRVYLAYKLTLVLNALAFACSACNPLMYTLFSQKFRTRFVALLCCRKTESNKFLTSASCANSSNVRSPHHVLDKQEIRQKNLKINRELVTSSSMKLSETDDLISRTYGSNANTRSSDTDIHLSDLTSSFSQLRTTSAANPRTNSVKTKR